MRRIFGMLVAATVALFAVGRATAGDEATQEPRRIALVIGVSSYSKLGADLQLDSARTEAARVAAALEQGAGFDQVRLLTDASASRANVETVLREQVSKEVQWRDLFLVYFVGHGVGADFGDPRLVMYDTDPDAIEDTAISVKDLAVILQKYVPASRYVVITDAAHPGSINGLSLLGPTGNDWPVLGNQSFVLSSAAPRQVTSPGVFSKAFVEAVSGRADTNSDGVISGSELNNYLVVAVPNATGGQQLPTVQSSYTPTIEVTAKRKAVVTADPTAAPPAAKVDKAKFVFQGGSSPRVQCGGMPASVLCDPSCYVWDVTQGDCTVSMMTGGASVSGSVKLLYRGAYTCGLFEGAVQCSSPPPP